MRLATRLSSHLARARYQFGSPLILGGRKFKLRGYHANRLATDFNHEAHLLKLIRRLLSEREGSFIDVGVNIGQTLIKVLSVDASRQYLGLEPQLDCSFFVSQFIRDNGLTQAIILPIALAETNTMMKFFCDGDYDEMASIIPGQRRFSCWVPARVGDEVLKELHITDISVLKIDVEGAELQVLRGLASTLRRAHAPVLFEVLPNFIGVERKPIQPADRDQNNARAAELWDFLCDAGYKIAQIDDQGIEIPIGRFELDDPGNFISQDYIARFN